MAAFRDDRWPQAGGKMICGFISRDVAVASRVSIGIVCFCLCLVLDLVASHPGRAAGFVDAPSLQLARSSHSATLLADGEVVVVGGDPYTASAERYVPQAGTWRGAATPLVRRRSHTGTLLSSGKLLLAGGLEGTFLRSAELYTPASDSWAPAAPMGTARVAHSATLLPSGKVLVAGGTAGGGNLWSTETYDPVSNAWNAAASLPRARYGHTATLLPSGQVLVAGGHDGEYLKSADLYDPAADRWTPAGALAVQRVGHVATLLSSGKVLVTGGFGDEHNGNFGFFIASAEVYDPATNAWSPAGFLRTARRGHTATLLGSGKVLVAGGAGDEGVIAGAEIYDPDTNGWKAAGALATARDGHQAVLLASGSVLVTAGSDVAGSWLRSAELYDPDTTTALALDSIAPAATVVGQSYQVDFHVHGVAGAPTGSVAISDGQGSSCGPVVLSNGAGSCTMPSTEAGGYVLSAAYTPDTGAFAASSATAHHAVNRADTMLAIADHAPEPSLPTQPVTVTATLAVLSPGAGTPSGPVAISDGVDSCSSAPGEASCALTLTTRGPRTLSASYAGDGNFAASSAQVTHRVNQLPVVTQASYATNEDAVLKVPAAHGLLAQASDPDGDALVIANAGTLTAAGIGGTVVLNADGGFSYTPPAFAHGAASFDYGVGDGYETVAATATMVVEFVNHAPSFTLATLPKWPAGSSGPNTRAGFASVTDFGAPNEADQQVLAWHVRTLSDPEGVVSNVTIAQDGTVAYALSGRAGTATIGVALQDDGGTEHGGHDTSDEQSFTIRVAAGLDLSIRIGSDSDFVAGGTPVDYTIVVHNAGPNDALGARVKDVLPANLVDAAWACTATAGASCTPVGSGDIDDAVTLPSGASLTYSLIATVLADPEMKVEYAVSVVAPNGVPDMNPANNSATRYNTVGVFFDGFEQAATDAKMRAQDE